jgi:hypothetical protein
MLNAIINTGVLIGTFWQLGEMLKGHADPDKQITISLVTGMAPNAGGSIPHIAVWDREGNRVGQYKGDANGHIDDASTKTITISPTQNGGHMARPEYVLIVMQETDAICLSGIIAMGNSAQWTWTGDLGYTCGAQWYPSKESLGTSNVPVKCVWMDKDHTNGIIAKGLSLHMPDFSGDEGLVNQYKQDQRRLCQNTARMTFQPEPVVPDSLIKIFKPPIEYNDKGGPKRPNQGIDRKTRAYPDGTNMHIHDTRGSVRVHPKDILSRNSAAVNVQGVKNNMPNLLIVSSINGHSAKEVCQDPNSLGPDFVHTGEKLFCDMETARTWPVCDGSVTEGCFDLETKSMKNFTPGNPAARSVDGRHNVPAKSYQNFEEWK